MNARRLVVLLLVISAAQFAFIVHLLNRPTFSPVPSETKTIVSSVAARKEPRTIVRTNKFDWRFVESSDYRAYIENLRAIGCPEETVRDIIIADIDKMFAARLRSLNNPSTEHQKYWLPLQNEFSRDQEVEAEGQRRKLEQEKRELIRELLGTDLVAERKKAEGLEDVTDQRLNFLPAEKRDRLRFVLDKFSERESAILQSRADEGGVLTAEDRSKLKQLRADRDAEMAAVLTPEERQLYDYWTSNAGITARYVLGALDNPTEQEFQTIYRLQKEFDDKLDPTLTDVNDSPNAWQTAREELSRRMRQALGDQRFAEYERAQDLDYRNILDVTTRLQLPKESAAEIYDLKRAIQQEVGKVYADAQLNEQERELKASQLRKQAGRKVQDILGTVAFDRYLNNGNTGWFEVE